MHEDSLILNPLGISPNSNQPGTALVHLGAKVVRSQGARRIAHPLQ